MFTNCIIFGKKYLIVQRKIFDVVTKYLSSHLFDDHIPQLHRKVFLRLPSFGAERVDVRLADDPDLQLLVVALDDARHAQVDDGQAELELVAHPHLVQTCKRYSTILYIDRKAPSAFSALSNIAQMSALSENCLQKMSWLS